MGLLLSVAGCHDPEELTPSVVNMGLNSVSAQFASGEYKNDAQARFTTLVTDSDQERIAIDIPYYFPESSTNRVDITQMRVSANLDDNCFLTPKLGTLDLTQEHWFTLTRVDGTTRKICITGNIKKSDKCQLEAFALPSLGLTGVIDQEKAEVSIIALGDLEPAKATYQLSYHASISPDPAAEALDYNNEVKLTVTAFDGVTKKTYTVKKNVPSKTKSGIRAGSQKNLFVSETFKQQWGMSGTMNYTMGLMGDYLVVCSGESEMVYVNKLTGEKVGNVNMGGIDLKNGTNGAAPTQRTTPGTSCPAPTRRPAWTCTSTRSTTCATRRRRSSYGRTPPAPAWASTSPCAATSRATPSSRSTPGHGLRPPTGARSSAS